MEVNVKLFATLRDGRFKENKVELDEKSRVLDVMKRFDLPREHVAISMVNGRDVDNEYTLQDGDTLSLFPPVGGG